jgi:single-strand DNA-binding protein
LAEVAEKYLKKGASIYIEGKIKTRKWEDKEGNTRYNTEILADNMTMLGGKQSQEDSPSSAPASVTTDDKSDDLPF